MFWALEIFRLDMGQISSNLLKKAFAQWQYPFVSTSLTFYGLNEMCAVSGFHKMLMMMMMMMMMIIIVVVVVVVVVIIIIIIIIQYCQKRTEKSSYRQTSMHRNMAFLERSTSGLQNISDVLFQPIFFPHFRKKNGQRFGALCWITT